METHGHLLIHLVCNWWNAMFLWLTCYGTLCSQVTWNIIFLCFVINGTTWFLMETHGHLFLHLVCNLWNTMLLWLTWYGTLCPHVIWNIMCLWLVIIGTMCFLIEIHDDLFLHLVRNWGNAMILWLTYYGTLWSQVIWNIMFLWFVINGTMDFLMETHGHSFLHLVCNRWNTMFPLINILWNFVFPCYCEHQVPLVGN